MEERELKFRKLFLQLTLDHSNETSIDDVGNENDTSVPFSGDTFGDPLRRLMEEIEYNRITAEMGVNFAKVFTTLGFITFCINLVILAILASHKRLVFQQVFYLLIINFAIIDVSKGACLASHSLRFVLPTSAYEDRKVLATRIDQYVNIFFRLFNLETIFNLLMITLNEFIYIKFPLRYHQLIRRRLIVLLVFISWLISIVFTVTSSVIKSKDDTVFISTDTNNTETSEDRGSYKKENIRRTDTTGDGMDLHSIFTFALTGFCLFSLLVVLVCYTIFFKVIRDIQKYDRRLMVDANCRRQSELSMEGGDFQNLDERKLKRHLLRRYKYVLVIGSVILVYMLYLISYSSIQILQYFILSRRTAMTSEKMRSMLITRWTLVLLCGLHSTIQPICYFRMKEFREIVIRIFGYPCRCGRKRHTYNQDRSDYQSSLVDPPAVLAPTSGHTVIANSSVRYAKKACSLDEGHGDKGDEKRIEGRILNSKTFTNGIRTDRMHSVVRFEEGTALLLSTLSRRSSGILSSDDML